MKTTKLIIGGVMIGAGLIALPFAPAGAETANETVNGIIQDAITVSTSGTATMNVTPTGAGSISTASHDVTVDTNAAAGYDLTLATSTADRTLTDGTDTINPSTGTFASPIELAGDSWGYRVDGAGTFGAGPTTAISNQPTTGLTWAGVPAAGSPDTLKSTNGPASSDVTSVWYGLNATTAKPSGTYTNTVTYTATVK